MDQTATSVDPAVITADGADNKEFMNAPPLPKRRIYPWVVAALAFGLLLADYMSRQVLAAVFLCSRPSGR